MEGYLLTKASVLMKRKLSDVIKKAGHKITIEQWTILNALWENEGLIQTELAQKTFKDKTNLTRILDKLERDSLVERNKNINNRREHKITLTKKGSDLFKKLIPIAIANNESVLSILTADERNTLILSIEKIIYHLE
jgi:DNA-binding MarR family transcriptional regulator